MFLRANIIHVNRKGKTSNDFLQTCNKRTLPLYPYASMAEEHKRKRSCPPSCPPLLFIFAGSEGDPAGTIFCNLCLLSSKFILSSCLLGMATIVTSLHLTLLSEAYNLVLCHGWSRGSDVKKEHNIIPLWSLEWALVCLVINN